MIYVASFSWFTFFEKGIASTVASTEPILFFEKTSYRKLVVGGLTITTGTDMPCSSAESILYGRIAHYAFAGPLFNRAQRAICPSHQKLAMHELIGFPKNNLRIQSRMRSIAGDLACRVSP
jgi:hypothetical protein